MAHNRDGFLRRGENTLKKWDELDLTQWPAAFETPMVPEMVPFHGTDIYQELSLEERRGLEQEFIRFNAEMLIFLEGLFSQSFRDAIAREPLTPDTLKAVEHLIDEEDRHSKAFHDFLRMEGQENNHVLLNDKFLMWAFNKLVSISPLCCLITGAKTEAFSLGYAKHLRRHLGIDTNRWTKLHHYHMIDEAHHVPFQFDVYEEAVQNQGLWQEMVTFVCTLVFILLMQWVVFKCTWAMLKRALPQRSLLTRIGLTIKLVHWTIFIYPPMKDSRDHVKQILRGKQIHFGPLLRLIYR